MKDERLIRKHARAIVDIIVEMRSTSLQSVDRMSVLQRQLEAAMRRYMATGAPSDMESVTRYGKH